LRFPGDSSVFIAESDSIAHSVGGLFVLVVAFDVFSVRCVFVEMEFFV